MTFETAFFIMSAFHMQSCQFAERNQQMNAFPEHRLTPLQALVYVHLFLYSDAEALMIWVLCVVAWADWRTGQ